MRMADVLDEKYESKYLGCQTTGAKSDLKLPWRLTLTLTIWHTIQMAKHLPKLLSYMLKWRILDVSAAAQIQEGLKLLD